MPIKPQVPAIPADDGDLGAVFICAVRYCLGRATYMPKLVMDFIRPYIPFLENRTLVTMIRDIQDAPSYGMDFDKIAWLEFLYFLTQEATQRGIRL